MKDLAPAKDIAVGDGHSCIMGKNSAIYCWGFSGYGEVGYNGTASANTPMLVANLFVNPVAAYAGEHTSCTVSQSGQGYCWGRNTYGQVGDKSTTNRLIYQEVTALSPIAMKALALGGNHTCALTLIGAVYCWGWNQYGQLGTDPTTLASSLAAVKIGSFKDVTSLATGYNHSCLSTASGTVYCWGENTYGKLGDTTTTDRYTPTAVVW